MLLLVVYARSLIAFLLAVASKWRGSRRAVDENNRRVRALDRRDDDASSRRGSVCWTLAALEEGGFRYSSCGTSPGRCSRRWRSGGRGGALRRRRGCSGCAESTRAVGSLELVEVDDYLVTSARIVRARRDGARDVRLSASGVASQHIPGAYALHDGILHRPHALARTPVVPGLVILLHAREIAEWRELGLQVARGHGVAGDDSFDIAARRRRRWRRSRHASTATRRPAMPKRRRPSVMCLFADRLYTSSLCAVRVVSAPRASSTTTLCTTVCKRRRRLRRRGVHQRHLGLHGSVEERAVDLVRVRHVLEQDHGQRARARACVRFGGRERETRSGRGRAAGRTGGGSALDPVRVRALERACDRAIGGGAGFAAHAADDDRCGRGDTACAGVPRELEHGGVTISTTRAAGRAEVNRDEVCSGERRRRQTFKCSVLRFPLTSGALGHHAAEEQRHWGAPRRGASQRGRRRRRDPEDARDTSPPFPRRRRRETPPDGAAYRATVDGRAARSPRSKRRPR